MYRRFTRKIIDLAKWGKIFLPLKEIRYFPPQFIVRSPVSEGINHAFQNDYEVAIIVFNIKNLHDLSDQLGQQGYYNFIKSFKRIFRKVIELEINEDVILLHDYYSDGLTLLMRVDHQKHGVSAIDKISKKILRESEKKIFLEMNQIRPVFETGYMFIEKNTYSLQEAIFKAHQHALAMAEKRVQSEFNEMLYAVNKIVSTKDISILAQPIIDVETGETKAWEMLTRGPKDTELENPLQLFSVARQTGMLYELELIVIEKIFEHIHSARFKQDIFINVTPITLGNERFVREIKTMISKYQNISPKQITLEITERDSIEGIENFIYNLKIIRILGFRIALDDTGSGYASLNSISEIMPDIIKIDRAVIQDIDTNTVKESVLKGLLMVAKEVGSLVVAEGIERAEEASVLSRNKVHLAQGYFYARPDSLHKALLSS